LNADLKLQKRDSDSLKWAYAMPTEGLESVEEDSSVYLVCRICEKKVRMEFLQKHTTTCTFVEQTKTMTSLINDELMKV
jgi:hypothetical protein